MFKALFYKNTKCLSYNLFSFHVYALPVLCNCCGNIERHSKSVRLKSVFKNVRF